MANERGNDGDPLAEDLREETWAGRAVADEPSTVDVSGDDRSADDLPVEDGPVEDAPVEADETFAASEASGADRVGPFGERSSPPPPPPPSSPPPAAAWSPGRPRRSGAAAGAAAAAPAVPGAAAGGSPFDEAAPGGEVSFGTWLRRQREMREIDLREIADKTKISLRYLKAMEQGRFDVLPAPIFARGFLKEYSKYVGLNADEVVNYYLAAHEGRGLEAEADDGGIVDPGRSRSPVTRGALMVLLLIVAVAAIAYFVFYRRSQEEAERAAPPPIAAPVNEAVVAEAPPPPPPEPVLTAPLVVTLDLVQECWIEAHVDGVPQVSRLFVAGESLQLEAEESVQLTLGNGGGVEVQVNNMPFTVDAESGETLHLTIDLATVERLRQRSG